MKIYWLLLLCFILSACQTNRLELAKHSQTSQDTLLELAEDEDPAVREAVAANKTTKLEALTILADDEVAAVRANVAVHQNTRIRILEKLTKDKDTSVRKAVATNILTPNPSLAILAKDKNLDISVTACNHPNLPDDVIKELIFTPDLKEEVRLAVMRNARTSFEILSSLFYKRLEEVRVSEPLLIGQWEVLLEKEFGKIDRKQWLAASVKVRVSADSILREIAQNKKVLITLAEDKQTPPKVLDYLAREVHTPVRRIVAANSNASYNTLKLLTEDDDGDVKKSAEETIKKYNKK